VTRDQAQDVQGDVRFRAIRYFLTDFMTNDWAYLIGNGGPGSSQYGMRLTRLSERYGYYQSDIGLIGEYTMYGLLFAVGAFMILYRALSSRLPEGLMFIKYNFMGLILTLVTGGGAFGSSATNILINSMLLYLIDLYMHDKDSFKWILE